MPNRKWGTTSRRMSRAAMDLGLHGKKAIVCAASKGLGKCVAVALAREGVELIINARGRDALDATAEDIRRECGLKVTAIAADITSDVGRAAILVAFQTPTSSSTTRVDRHLVHWREPASVCPAASGSACQETIAYLRGACPGCRRRLRIQNSQRPTAALSLVCSRDEDCG